MPAAREGDHLLGEQGSQDRELLLDPPAPIGEGLVEGTELRLDPAQPDAKAQPTPDSTSTSAACLATSTAGVAAVPVPR
jgi:hypothetical protein